MYFMLIIDSANNCSSMGNMVVYADYPARVQNQNIRLPVATVIYHFTSLSN